jgi:hypothetical protein
MPQRDAPLTGLAPPLASGGANAWPVGPGRGKGSKPLPMLTVTPSPRPLHPLLFFPHRFLPPRFAAKFDDGSQAIGGAGIGICNTFTFSGFLPPIGGADATGGSATDPVASFKLKSTVPVKMTLTCGGLPVTTGTDTIQVLKVGNSTTTDNAIDATPTDATTTGNTFRLTDASTGEWHFNLDTKGLSKGVWKIIATLSDGTVHTAFIGLK